MAFENVAVNRFKNESKETNLRDEYKTYFPKVVSGQKYIDKFISINSDT